MTSRVSLGIDVGGTFTDFVLLDEDASAFRVEKRLTTPDDPGLAILEGTRALLEQAGLPLATVDRAVHGTTLVTNTIIERKGAPTGVITTRGWRDVLEIGRDIRYDLYDLEIDRPEPLVPRYLRKVVTERLDKDGQVVLPLAVDEVREAAADLVGNGIASVAVCLIHAYRNPVHEAAIGDILAAEFPDLHVTLSSDVSPEIREYERVSTTVANAYVQPLMKQYLASLERRLRDLGLQVHLHVMLSSGGITTIPTAERFPIRLIESGPAGGAMAAAFFGGLSGDQDLISFDMGGTTAKMCLISRGQPAHARQFEAARLRRFRKGSGLLLNVPVIELLEIGAGGGSIARVDDLGMLKVGPDSAGAMPGPVCYGRGGVEPAVTDADLLLGYIDAEYFLGGAMRLDREGAARAIQERIAGPLDVDLAKAAEGIFDVVNGDMASATRVYAAEHGYDPRGHALLAFGGAGPVHAYAIARLLRLRRVVCPLAAGTASALGFLLAPMSFDFVRSYVARLDAMDWGQVAALMTEMEDEGRAMLRDAGVADDLVRFERSADMRYVGQGYEIPVPLPPGALDGSRVDEVVQAFYRVYRERYSRFRTDVAVEALTWRVTASGPPPAIDLRVADDRSADASEAVKGRRRAFFGEAGRFVDCVVYDRYRLGPGAAFAGPAIVEERESTVVVGPSARASIDAYRNLVMEMD